MSGTKQHRTMEVTVMGIKEIRKRIDAIDRELLTLLGERMELGLRARRCKEETRDSAREAEVLDRARLGSPPPLDPGFAASMFESVMAESRRLQDRAPRLVAFQGEHGAYGEMAAHRLVPDGVAIPCTEFADVFTGLEQGAFDAGVVPVENLLEGAVARVDELLAGTSLVVAGEHMLPIHHSLLAPRGTDHREIRAVYSHPQALAQCRGFVTRNGLEVRPYYDTAGAARMLAREAPHGAAAIASTACAELYGLEVIKEEIEDSPENATRFLLLAREPAASGDKCSIVFATAHEAGQLHAALGLFAREGVNLTRVASLPMRDSPGAYRFLVDFEGSVRDDRVTRILDALKERTLTFRFLGCYPAVASPRS